MYQALLRRGRVEILGVSFELSGATGTRGGSLAASRGTRPRRRHNQTRYAHQPVSAAALMRWSVVVMPSCRSASRSVLPTHFSVSHDMGFGTGGSES